MPAAGLEPANIVHYKTHEYGISFFVGDNLGIIFKKRPIHPEVNEPKMKEVYYHEQVNI